jgi:hypothetical protein
MIHMMCCGSMGSHSSGPAISEVQSVHHSGVVVAARTGPWDPWELMAEATIRSSRSWRTERRTLADAVKP